MNPVTGATLGLFFLGVGLANTFLMYHLWGYAFDKTTRTSEAPRSLMLTHRVVGFVFAGIYIFMLLWMLPRMWNYQVEFPARSVAHLMLGFCIGFLLLVKISIMRFFRHLEEWMPYLGTAIILCAVLLMGLSVPFAFREWVYASRVVEGDVFSQENIERLQELLPKAGLPPEAPLADLATPESIEVGREVLLWKCVACHDLKTVLMRPRTPDDWARTVARMAAKPSLGDPITEEEQWLATAYLVAITPDLQRSVARLRDEEIAFAQSAEAVVISSAHTTELDSRTAESAFQETCSQCHTPLAVNDSPPRTPDEVDALIHRMVANGLNVTEERIRLVRQHLLRTFGEKSVEETEETEEPEQEQ